MGEFGFMRAMRVAVIDVMRDHFCFTIVLTR